MNRIHCGCEERRVVCRCGFRRASYLTSICFVQDFQVYRECVAAKIKNTVTKEVRLRIIGLFITMFVLQWSLLCALSISWCGLVELPDFLAWSDHSFSHLNPISVTFVFVCQEISLATRNQQIIRNRRIAEGFGESEFPWEITVKIGQLGKKLVEMPRHCQVGIGAE